MYLDQHTHFFLHEPRLLFRGPGDGAADRFLSHTPVEGVAQLPDSPDHPQFRQLVDRLRSATRKNLHITGTPEKIVRIRSCSSVYADAYSTSFRNDGSDSCSSRAGSSSQHPSILMQVE